MQIGVVFLLLLTKYIIYAKINQYKNSDKKNINITSKEAQMNQFDRAMDLACIDMLIDQALNDIRSGKSEHEEYGLGELADIAKARDLRGTDVARRAKSEFDRLMNEALTPGVLVNGQPLTRKKLKSLSKPEVADASQIPGLSGQRICVSPWRCDKKHFPGPRRNRAVC